MRSRLERVIQILKMLGSGVPYNPMQLAQETGANRRSIYRDISVLMSLGIPIIIDEKTSNYSMAPAKGGNEWLLGLVGDQNWKLLTNEALATDPDLVAARQESFDRIMAHFPANVREELKQYLLQDQPQPLSGQPQPNAQVDSGSPRVWEIVEAIQQAKPISIIVQTNRGTNVTMSFSPTRLQCVKAGWLLTGKNNRSVQMSLSAECSAMEADSMLVFSIAPSMPDPLWSRSASSDSNIASKGLDPFFGG